MAGSDIVIGNIYHLWPRAGLCLGSHLFKFLVFRALCELNISSIHILTLCQLRDNIPFCTILTDVYRERKINHSTYFLSFMSKDLLKTMNGMKLASNS